ncbi:MAG: hypothetical protein ACP5N1_04790 [Candidatus Woesearchaeota archaeon]
MGLETFIDKIRVNKYAEFSAVIGVCALYAGIADVTMMHDINFTSGMNVCLGVVNTLNAIYFTRKQNQRYEGIVQGIKEYGYSDKFCSMYMDHPCGRSVVKVALKRTENFDKYKELKKKYPLTRLL